MKSHSVGEIITIGLISIFSIEDIGVVGWFGKIIAFWGLNIWLKSKVVIMSGEGMVEIFDG